MVPIEENIKMKLSKLGIVVLLVLTIIIFVLIYNFFFFNPLKDVVTIEIGEKIPSANTFVLDNEENVEFITDINTINTSSIGKHSIRIKVGFLTKTTQLNIVDTIAPTGQGVKHEIWYDETLEINDFVTNIVDQTTVKLSYSKAPDFSLLGSQKVVVSLIDEGNNQKEVESELIIKADNETPKILGVKDQLVFTGEPISYRKGIEVIDNKDPQLDFEVDNSQVNINQPGQYEVTYLAKDLAGNKTTEKSMITVKEKPIFLLSKEELNTRGDKILDQITNENMSDLQVLNAIFWYTRWNIKYTGQSDKTSWEIGASKALEEMEGDCFNYYALAHLLLDRSGFEYKPVKRVEGSRSRHYWLFVKYEDLWYHFDPTWSPVGYEFDGFMISEEEAKAFTKLVSPIRDNYYIYDSSLYKDIEIAQKPLKKN